MSEASVEIFGKDSVISNLLESFQELAVILDKNRKIVYRNSQFKSFAAEAGLNAEIGLTPGEAFNCIQVSQNHECGKSNLCKYCGGNKVITESLNGGRQFSLCQIASSNGTAFNLKVSAAPLCIEGEAYTLYCILDNSAEVRKNMLEKIFFHDINNIVNGMNLIAEMASISCENNDIDECGKNIEMLKMSLNSLISEISSQHIITLAEKHELHVSPKNFRLNELICEISDFFSSTFIGSGIIIKCPMEEQPETVINSDPTLLKRVLINMMKNACEASGAGQVVTLTYQLEKNLVRISVHNEAVMSELISSTLFTRTISTKGEGRGLGTYSMRLLSERYLKGRVFFSTAEGEGTTFYVEIPVILQDLL
jgi:hypothetical protein